MKSRIRIAVLSSLSFTLCCCSDGWLEPKPLSFYTPENSFVNAEGFYSILTSCEKNMRTEFFGDGAPILTEMIQSDLAVEGGPLMDLDKTLLPDANLSSMNTTQTGWYWNEGYKAIQYANSVISRIDNIKWTKEEERNAILGSAYFHRAYRYNKLVHQYGNVPYLDREFNSPKYDFYTYDRWSILEQMKKDMEFAYKWVPEKVDRGRVSKSACGVLLMKICMALCEFDQAIGIGKEIVALHPLMKERFTANKTKPKTNLMHDLHSVEAKLDASNTEGIMYIVSMTNVEGSVQSFTMRNGVPCWFDNVIKTPDGRTGTSTSIAKDETDPEMDLNQTYGRGIGRLRPTNYYQYTIWTEKEKKDLRGIYNRDSWRGLEDLRYNEPSLKGKSKWYGQNLIRPVSLSVSDSIRCWYQWPHYKLFVPDPLQTTNWKGGETPWYVYRSAEVYLMLAECYYWKGEFQLAATALNEVRLRAGATPLMGVDVNIGAILDERARELYYEESRHVELVRISYTYAKTGKPCDVLGGKVYSMDNLSGPGSPDVKQAGYNFWYDWIAEKNNFYNKGIKTKFAEYKISVHHILWPVPAGSINTNLKGIINQNIGYPGTEKNRPPLLVSEKK